MKKYISAILIPCLLLQFSGCYNMQTITKDEFLQDSDYFELNVKTKNKDISFETGNYSVSNDTIFGKGTVKSRIDQKIVDESFEGAISINQVEEIRAYKFNVTAVIALTLFVVITAVFIVLADPIGDFSMSH